MKNQKIHLSEADIIIAVVDRTELEPQKQAHLDNCGFCRNEIQFLASSLDRMGDMARQSAPLPAKQIDISQKPFIRKSFFSKNLKIPVLASAMAFVVLILFVMLFPFTPNQQTVNIATIEKDMAQNQVFMNEVDALIADPLPEGFMELSESSFDGYIEDPFLEFMVPLKETSDSVDAATPKTHQFLT